MKLNGMSKLAVLLVVLGVLAACGQEEYAPRAINEETDICVICNMAVKDDQYATQIVTTDGQSLLFDDIGCMNEWKTENGTETIGAEYVRDFHNKQWIKYDKAYYVYDASYKTPMAYGVVSFEEESDAERFIEEQGAGKLMTADDLAHHSWEVNRDMMNMPGHSHGEDGEMQEHDEQAEHDGDMEQHS